MRFYDEAVITVESGKGGDGTVTGRREAGVPFGGPSGGNGGKGGSIIFKASKDENTLVAYKYRRQFKAKPGEAGKSRDQYGAGAEDLLLDVPVGTLIRDVQSGEVLHVFAKDGESREVAKGGDGGAGNMHFRDAIHQFPNFCLLGEPGQKREVMLELQLLADVALIGTPSVGKSSIINAIAHTKAKVAEYPFTTLVPNLGCVHRKKKTFNVIDIPGLIKGSAQGKGLGNAFLRHVLKARVFALVVDIARYDPGILEISALLEEIFSYVQQKFSPVDTLGIKKDGKYLLFYAERDGEIVLEKRMIFVINKYDLVNDEEILNEYKKALFKDILVFLKKKKTQKAITETLIDSNTIVMSAVTHVGVDGFLDKVIDEFHGLKMEEVYHIANYSPSPSKIEGNIIEEVTKEDKEFLIEEKYMDPMALKYARIWRIQHFEICKLVWMLPWGNPEAEHRFWKKMDQEGFLEIFDKAGIVKGDILKIVSFYPGKEDRYLLY